jgi:hypothetical protein
MLPEIFSSQSVSFIGLLMYGLTPMANSPTYRAPSAVSRMWAISSADRPLKRAP